jgi:hypothetical protein
MESQLHIDKKHSKVVHYLWKEAPSDSKVCIHIQPPATSQWNSLSVPATSNCCHALNVNIDVSTYALN